MADPWDDHSLLLGRFTWYLYVQINAYVYTEDQRIDMKMIHHHREMLVDSRSQRVVGKVLVTMIICIKMLRYVKK
jgi:hypothetical protein